MIENYLSRPSEELEGTAADRAGVRNATFSIEERPSGTRSQCRVPLKKATSFSWVQKGLIATAHSWRCFGWTIRLRRVSVTRSKP